LQALWELAGSDFFDGGIGDVGVDFFSASDAILSLWKSKISKVVK